MANANVRFLGRVSDPARSDLLSRCRALILPGEEDFGLAPLEANACGKPVLAFARGGAVETVIDGVTGKLFDEPTAPSLAETVIRLGSRQFDRHVIRQHAEKFGKAKFQAQIRALVAGQLQAPGPLADRKAPISNHPDLINRRLSI